MGICPISHIHCAAYSGASSVGDLRCWFSLRLVADCRREFSLALLSESINSHCQRTRSAFIWMKEMGRLRVMDAGASENTTDGNAAAIGYIPMQLAASPLLLVSSTSGLDAETAVLS